MREPLASVGPPLLCCLSEVDRLAADFLDLWRERSNRWGVRLFWVWQHLRQQVDQLLRYVQTFQSLILEECFEDEILSERALLLYRTIEPLSARLPPYPAAVDVATVYALPATAFEALDNYRAAFRDFDERWEALGLPAELRPLVTLMPPSAAAPEPAAGTVPLAPETTGDARVPSVILRGFDDPPIVLGKPQKKKLLRKQFDVLSAVIAAGEGGLSGDELARKSGYDHAVAILVRIKEKNEDWDRVILRSGKEQKGYRILFQSEGEKNSG